MRGQLIEQVALALFASDGLKFASREISLEQSWEMQPEVHIKYSEKAIVFVKVMGQQMVGLADAEIARLDAARPGNAAEAEIVAGPDNEN